MTNLVLVLAALTQVQTGTQWRLQQERLIGSVGGEHDALTQILSLAVDREGQIYLTQWQKPTVTVFDSAGRFVRTIGRSGKGPGDFVRPGRIGWKADTLWVADRMNQRISLFNEGVFARSVTFAVRSASGFFSAHTPGALLADGTVLSIGAPYTSLLADGRISRLPFLRFTEAGDLIDTLAFLPIEHFRYLVDNGKGTKSFLASPFATSGHFDFSQSGRHLAVVSFRQASSHKTLVEVRKYHLSAPAAGRVPAVKLSQRNFSVDKTKIPKSLVEEHIQRSAASVADLFPNKAAAEVAVRKALKLPEFRAPVTAVLIDTEARLWLRREEPSAPTVYWVVLSAAGERIATVAVPAKLKLLHASDTTVWGSMVGDLDIPQLIRYRIRKNK